MKKLLLLIALFPSLLLAQDVRVIKNASGVIYTQTPANVRDTLASIRTTGVINGQVFVWNSALKKLVPGTATVDSTIFRTVANSLSKAQIQTALNLKANLNSPTFTGTVSGITKSMVGLGNVDNTSDASKPVSTAQQTALNLKIDLTQKGAAGGVATLDGSGKVPLTQVNDALLGAVNYQGTYNASTNTPALATPSSANKGWYYIVSTAGTQGSITYAVGDWAISNGVAWAKVDNNNAVTSVFGRQGAVTAQTGDYSAFYQGLSTRTTVGNNFYTLANPSAITFPRINADNTVTALSAAAYVTAIGAAPATGSTAYLPVNNPTATGTLTAPNITWSGGTAGRIPFLGTGGAFSNSANLVWDNTNGWLGVGKTPVAPITTVASTLNANLYERGPANFYSTASVGGGGFGAYKSRGTPSSPAAVVNGDGLALNGFGGFDGTNWLTTAWISTAVSGTVSTGTIPTDIIFNTGSANNGATEKLRIPATGAITSQVAINSASGFIGPLTGNASTATTLQTARTISGVSFNGSANIVIPASGITNTPAGGIAATNVQAAINELDTEKANIASPTFTGTVTTPALTIPTGAVAGRVWTSDASGVGSWQAVASSYKGTWNASTNTPTLADGVGTLGDYYVVSTGGTALGRTFVTGGQAIYNGSIWQPVGTASGVTSFASRTGAISPIVGDYSSFYPLLNGTGATGTWGIGISGNAATATALATARTIGTLTGDITSAGSSFDGTANNTNVATLATVNSNVGTFGSATQVPVITVNAKGLTTAASNVTITPAVGSITGLGTGVAAALGVNTGTTGAFVVRGGDAGTPSALVGTNITGTAPGLSIGGTASNVTGTVAITNGGTGATTAAAARTNLGGTTLGQNLFTLTNPAAIRFPRFNADNSVSSLTDAQFRVAIGAAAYGGSSGYVSMFNASDPSLLSNSGIYFTGSEYGFGTTSPTSISGYQGLSLDNAANGNFIDFKYSGTTLGRIINDATTFNINAIGSIPTIFGANNIEQMRISSSGIRLSALGGTGTRMVVVDNLGNASTQAIPSGGGGGTVTSVGVNSANGFAGTSSGGANPALTISTTVSGILSGNGTAISAASTTGSGNVVLSASPALTGNPTAPTQSQGDNSTKLATTAYTDAALNFALASTKQIDYTTTQTTTGISTGNVPLRTTNIPTSWTSVGDKIEFSYVGSFEFGASDKYVTLVIGGQSMAVSGNASNGTFWKVDGYIIRDGATAGKVFLNKAVYANSSWSYASALHTITPSDWGTLDIQIVGQTNGGVGQRVYLDMATLQGRKAP